MSINFTKDVEQYTTTHRSNKVKQFTDFPSKKQLEEAGVLAEDKMNFVKEIKGTFNFALHEDGRYMAVTLYKAHAAERKYSFLVVDLNEFAIAEVVNDDNIFTCIQKFNYGMRTDIAGTAGNKNGHMFPPKL